MLSSRKRKLGLGPAESSEVERRPRRRRVDVDKNGLDSDLEQESSQESSQESKKDADPVPLLSDFEGRTALDPGAYDWGPRAQDEADESEGVTALFPLVPDPYDDTDTPLMHIPADYLYPSQPPPSRRRQGLMSLPLELRLGIYRHILVAKHPIRVFNGWKQVYERERPGLETSILLVNKQIFWEAARILYGENTFYYLLRDPLPNRCLTAQVNVQTRNRGREQVEEAREAEDPDGAAHGPTPNDSNSDDGDQEEAESPDDAAYEPEEDQDQHGRQLEHLFSMARRPGKLSVINIAKYGEMMRHISIEAESNRHSHETLETMAQAINVFTPLPGNKTKAFGEFGPVPRIHTLMIRVTPTYCKGGGYTFVDFFKHHSLVHEACAALSCQVLKIELNQQHISGRKGPQRGQVVLNMRNLRFGIRQDVPPAKRMPYHEFWRGDKLMKVSRTESARRAAYCLIHIEDILVEHCDEHLNPQVRRGTEDADDDIAA